MSKDLNNLADRTFLLGVGAQKAGTSWLYRYLKSHPEIYMSPIKEMHFFGNRHSDKKWPIPAFRRKLRERSKRDPLKNYTALRDRIKMKDDISKYISFFQKRIKEEPVFGEITPLYCTLDRDELAYIKSTFPLTKVIFILRNPADRLWSQMRVKKVSKYTADLTKRIREVIEIPAFISRSDYSATVQNLQQVFPPENIHIDFYETLFCKEGVERICSFLKIEYNPAKFDAQYNVSAKAQLGTEHRRILIDSLRDQYTFALEEFGQRVPESWKNDIS